MFRKSGGWVLRGAVLVVAFACGLAAFRMGVGTDARDSVQHADLLTHLYYTLGLFVLGGLDLGVPQGGPKAARAMLWVAYFLAPLITTSAVIEGLLRLLRPAWIARRGLGDHVVIVGVGRLGLLFLELVRERSPRTRVLIVDNDAQRANVQVAQDRYGARFIPGDIRRKATLDALSLDRARAVALLTDDDLVNLDAAWQVGETTRADVVAHITDIGLRRTAAGVDTNDRIHLFNSHVIAATRLYHEHLETHFQETVPEDVVVLAGFGRFGHTILEYLQREAKGEIQRVVVLDAAAHRQVPLFRAQVPGFEDSELVTIEGDLQDPDIWDRVEEQVGDAGVTPVYVIATDDDQLNVRAAIALRSLHAEARIFVRTTYASHFSSHIAKEKAFTILPIDTLLRSAMKARIDDWLGERKSA